MQIKIIFNGKFQKSIAQPGHRAPVCRPRNPQAVLFTITDAQEVESVYLFFYIGVQGSLIPGRDGGPASAFVFSPSNGKDTPMPQTAIFDAKTKKRPMRVAGFMSGSGTNITKLVGLQNKLRAETGECPFEVVFIFSDRSDGKCQGENIALNAGIPYFSYDIRRFHAIRGLSRNVTTSEGLDARIAYDETAKKLVEAFEVDVIALGGYMSYITLRRCVNVHPADLTIKNADGSRRFVGDYAVKDAILAGETTLRASTLWTDEGVDTGPLLLVSRAVKVQLPVDLETLRQDGALLDKTVDENQERLKEIGDWEVFPQTVLWIAQGRLGLDENSTVYLNGAPLADCYRLREA